METIRRLGENINCYIHAPFSKGVAAQQAGYAAAGCEFNADFAKSAKKNFFEYLNLNMLYILQKTYLLSPHIFLPECHFSF
jgi:hypothetical protein